jgi:hypothetical protein
MWGFARFQHGGSHRSGAGSHIRACPPGHRRHQADKKEHHTHTATLTISAGPAAGTYVRAWWFGFLAGIFLMLLSGALLAVASRAFRKKALPSRFYSPEDADDETEEEDRPRNRGIQRRRDRDDRRGDSDEKEEGRPRDRDDRDKDPDDRDDRPRR